MRILVLGGTRFLGRHLVEAGLGRGHELTLFHRGQTGRDLFPGVERRLGDRDGGLAALDHGRWDAVVDTCGYVPRLVKASAEALADRVGLYAFISSISVYADFPATGIDESYPVGRLEDVATETIDGDTYGPLKALCEEMVIETLPGRALIIRPGLIVGPDDPTDRFSYWVGRLRRGGEVLAPAPPAQPVQFIDARDLAAWTLDLLERGVAQTFHATGPARPTTLATLLATCRQIGGAPASLTWVSPAFLAAHDVAPWTDLPLGNAQDDEDHAGMQTVDIGKALAAGLTLRPPADTVRDTLAWLATRPADYAWRAGISPEREADLLAAWHRRNDQSTAGAS